MSLSCAFDSVSYAVVQIPTKDRQHGSLWFVLYTAAESWRLCIVITDAQNVRTTRNLRNFLNWVLSKIFLQTQNLSFKQKFPAEIRYKTHRAELIWLEWGWQGPAEITYLLLKIFPLVIPLNHNHKTPKSPENLVRKWMLSDHPNQGPNTEILWYVMMIIGSMIL